MQLGGDIKWINKDYGGEVVNGLVKLSIEKKIYDQLTASKQFSKQAVNSKESVTKELRDLSSTGLRVAIWGVLEKPQLLFNIMNWIQISFRL